MTAQQMYPYEGFEITVLDGQELPFAVFDPRDKKAPALFKATSLDAAMRWVDAYRMGHQWAEAAKTSGR